MAAHVGLLRGMTGSASLKGTGTAITAGANTTITGTAAAIAIIVNMNEGGTTTGTNWPSCFRFPLDA
jgi:hypothetical protein